MLRNTCVMLGAVFCLSSALSAEDATTNVAFEFDGQTRNISQADIADTDRVAALNRRPAFCDTLCVGPTFLTEGVATIGEQEVIDFITTSVASGEGLLIDSRAVDSRDTGAIVTSINLPTELLDQSNPFRNDILVAMGARAFEGVLNFSDAMPVMVYDNGPLFDDASRFVSALVEAGYPAEKIQYYRGGLQVWAALGLSIEETAS